MPKKAPQKKTTGYSTGFSMAELAKILNVKMSLPCPDAMDSWADRNHSANINHRTQGRAGTTASKDVEQLCKEGHCFTCNKQGHISQNCPDKLADNKPTNPKKNSKACQANIDDDETSDGEDYRSPELNTWVCKGKTLTKDQKVAIINRAIAVHIEMEVGEEADFKSWQIHWSGHTC